MNFKDRGNKKWTSLMLVEHQKKLKELKLKENDQKKPELDQQQLEEINFKIQDSLNKNSPVKIIYYENKKIKKLKGTILKIEKYNKKIIIKLKNDQKQKLSFKQIIEVFL